MANDIIDVSSLMGNVETGRQNLTRTNPMQLLQIKHEQNKHATSTAIAEADIISQSGLVQQAQFEQQGRYVEGKGQLAIDAAKFQGNVAKNLAEETAALRQNREALERSYRSGLEEHTNLVENANYSFWRNPLTYIRDQYRIQNSVSKLNDINSLLQATYNSIDQEYAQAAQELQHYRQTSMTQALVVHEVENMIRTNSLLSKQAQVANYQQQLGALQRGSAARQTVSEGYQRLLKDENEQRQLWRYMHKIQTGSYEGYNDLIGDRYKQFYTTLTDEQRQDFARGYLRAADFDAAGVEWSVGEHMEDIARNNDGESLAQLAWLSRDQGLMALVDLGMQSRIGTTYAELSQQWAKDNPQAFLANGNKIPTSVDNALRRQAQEQVQRRPGQDALVTSSNLVEKDMQRVLAERKDSIITYAGAAELVELAGHSPQAVRYFQSESFRNLSTTGAEGPYDGLSNFTMALSEELVNSGVPAGEVPSVIADYYAQSGLALYSAQGDYGLELDSLQRLGRNLRPSIPVRPLPVNGLVARISNFTDGPNAQYFRRADFDFTDPVDIQNFLARAQVAQEELGRSANFNLAAEYLLVPGALARDTLPQVGNALTYNPLRDITRAGGRLVQDVVEDTQRIPGRIRGAVNPERGGVVSDAARRRQNSEN